MQFLNSLVVFCLLGSGFVILPQAYAQEPAPIKNVGERKGGPNIYGMKVAELNKMEEKVRENRKSIQELVVLKMSTKDKKKKHELVKAMLELHRGERELQTKYNKKLFELRYRFPEKDDRTDRRYLPMREQSLAEIKEEMGVDADLSRLKHKVELKYKSFVSEDDRRHDLVELQKRKKTKPRAANRAAEKPKKLRLEK